MTGRNRGKGQMSVEEAGRKGGESRKEQLGPEGYSELGKMGGEARKEQLGADGYSELGRKGGQAVQDEVRKFEEIKGKKGTR